MSNDALAAKWFAESRWPNGIECPQCDSPRVAERPRPECRWTQWRCRDCRKEFTAVTGTELHGTRLSPSQAEQRQHNRQGSTQSGGDPVSSLSRGTKRVLNALGQRPRGATIGKIAEVAGLSERHTRRLLSQLIETGLVRKRVGNVRNGHRTSQAPLWELTYSSDCIEMLGRIPRYRAPMAPMPDRDAVPPQFWSMFWSGSEGSELSLSRDELHIAATLIGSVDLSAEAWALRTVSTETLETLAESRGYDSGDINSLIRTELWSRSHAEP